MLSGMLSKPGYPFAYPPMGYQLSLRAHMARRRSMCDVLRVLVLRRVWHALASHRRAEVGRSPDPTPLGADIELVDLVKTDRPDALPDPRDRRGRFEWLIGRTKSRKPRRNH